MIYMLIFLREKDIFEFFYNTVCNSALLIYTKYLFSLVYLRMNFTVRLIQSVKLLIKITRHRIFMVFFIPSFSTAIPSIYTDIMFLSVFTDGYSDEKFHR